MAKSKKTYDESSIEFHEGLDGVRKRPNVYLGGKDSEAVTHAVIEIIGNSVDEATEGFGSSIGVYVGIDGKSVTIWDFGRGVPYGPHPKHKDRSTLEIIFTELNAGGKFGTSAYNTAIGCLHGDTPIKLMDGSTVAIRELHKRWQKDPTKFWVYGFDKDNPTHPFKPALCYNVQISKKTRHLVEVTLNDGQTIKCTPDHPFLTIDDGYVKAGDLAAGTSLRSLYTVLDKDGYETHSGFRHPSYGKPSFGVKPFMRRTHRTALSALGMDVQGAQVHHKNTIKNDNRPNNLEVAASVMEHWWKDRLENGKRGGGVWDKKNKKARLRSKHNMQETNNQPGHQERARLGRIVQIAARALRDHGVVTEATYNASINWCGTKFDKAMTRVSLPRLRLLAREYLDDWEKRPKRANGGQGLNYKLQSEYERSPADNANEKRVNHTVASVRKITLKRPIPVYDLSVEGTHNYLLGCGVFVSNTHGMGAAVANAICTEFSVWSFRDGHCGHQSYSKGKPTGKLTKKKVGIASVKDILPNWAWATASKLKTGTVIHMALDLSVFEKGAKLDVKRLRKWLDDLSWFVPKIKFHFGVGGTLPEIIHRPNGLQERYTAAAKAHEAEPVGEPFSVTTEHVDALVGWLSGTSENSIHSAVNAVETKEHGTHYNALVDAVYEALQGMAKRGDNFTKDSLRVGLVAVVNVRMSEAEFSGQSKAKLTSPSAKEPVRAALLEGKQSFPAYLKKHKELARQIIDRANALSHLNDTFKAGQKLAASLKLETRGKSLLPASLKNASTNNPEERVLYLVEGASALGTCMAARDVKTDELLPLTGKIPNVWRDPGKVSTNDVLIDILKSIGFDPKTPDSFRVGKVVLLMDADVDGMHLTALVLGMVHKVAPLLLKAGKVYVVDAPLFIYRTDKEVMHCLSYADARRRVQEKGGKFDPERLQRVKGWGEISPSILRDVAFLPSTRKFARVGAVDSMDSLSMLDGLLGSDPALRKKLLNV